MANKFLGAISHIGGADGDLDKISKDVISDGDGGYVVDAVNNTIDFYTLVGSDTTAEDSTDFTVILPDDETPAPAAGKRWFKVNPRGWDGTDAVDFIADLARRVGTPDALNLCGMDADGDPTDSNVIASWIDQDVSSGSTPTLTATNISGAPADFIDAITEIKSTVKSGADVTLVTGTKGDANDFPIWNGDGDIVGSGLNVAETGVLATAAEWGAQQNFNEASATSAGAAVEWNLNTKQCAVHTLTEDTTIGSPLNMHAGGHYTLRVIQAAGLWTLAWNAVFKWGVASAPAAPAANGDVAIFSFYSDGTSMYGVEAVRVEA
jgi:hypothetical protein